MIQVPHGFGCPLSFVNNCPTSNKYTLDINGTTRIIDTVPEILVYGTGEVGGLRISEDVYLFGNDDLVVKELTMLGIVQANGIDGDAADGILGLGPMKTIADRGNFVTALKEQGLIDYEMFSFDFQLQEKKSKMIFGDVDREIVNNLHDLIWLPVDGDGEYWSLPCREVHYGNNKTISMAEHAVIDTGSSTVALAEGAFLELMQSILETKLECGFFIDEKFVACFCENGLEDFSTIHLNLGGHVFDLNPEDYVANEQDICVILIYNLGDRLVVTDDTIVLGANFLRKYYTVFDIELTRVGIHGDHIRAKMGTTEILWLTSIALAFILATILLIWYLHFKDKQYAFRKDGSITSAKKKATMHSNDIKVTI